MSLLMVGFIVMSVLALVGWICFWMAQDQAAGVTEERDEARDAAERSRDALVRYMLHKEQRSSP